MTFRKAYDKAMSLLVCIAIVLLISTAVFSVGLPVLTIMLGACIIVCIGAVAFGFGALILAPFIWLIACIFDTK